MPRDFHEAAMQERITRCLYIFILSIAPAVSAGPDNALSPQLQSIAPILSQPSMNLFRRFAADPSAMYEFYGKVLGLQQLSTFDLGGKASVARFQVGASEIKLTAMVPNRQYHRGGVQDATGLRLLTFFFSSQDSLAERFRTHNLPVPEFRPIPGSNQSRALVKDPDGQWVELVIAPDAPAATYDRIEIGLTVSNLIASRKFYRDFVGLEELPQRIQFPLPRNIFSATARRPSTCAVSPPSSPRIPEAAASNMWFRTSRQ
jgi:catechol 2,3-dioxygenase-like lactoylglutathione lyase family enzyme